MSWIKGHLDEEIDTRCLDERIFTRKEAEWHIQMDQMAIAGTCIPKHLNRVMDLRIQLAVLTESMYALIWETYKNNNETAKLANSIIQQ